MAGSLKLDALQDFTSPFSSRHYAYFLSGASILVETLLEAGTNDVLSEVATAIDRLAASAGEHQ